MALPRRWPSSWANSWRWWGDREAWRAAVRGVVKNCSQLGDWTTVERLSGEGWWNLCEVGGQHLDRGTERSLEAPRSLWPAGCSAVLILCIPVLHPSSLLRYVLKSSCPETAPGSRYFCPVWFPKRDMIHHLIHLQSQLTHNGSREAPPKGYSDAVVDWRSVSPPQSHLFRHWSPVWWVWGARL